MRDSVCCIGTGPSLTLEQIQVARERGFRLFGANLVYQIVPDLEVLYGCNKGFWDRYYAEAKDHPCEKWTTNLQAAQAYGLNWIGERWGADGLCTDPNVIFHGHGSGFSTIGIAHKLGARRIVLLGYDMRYPAGYDPQRRIAGGKRHFFGEYPAELQHWPGQPFTDLLPLYQAIHEQGLVEIVNCTPGSALEGVIPSMSIEEA